MATRYEVLPIPAIARYTRILEAGCVSFGIEYRLLNEQIIAEEYGEDARAQFGNVTPDVLGDVIDEDGVSVHVFGSEDGQEQILNSDRAVDFRRRLDVERDPICRRCVCTLHLGAFESV